MSQAKRLKSSRHAALLIGVASSILILESPPASAQQTSSAPIETVVVTGTLIHRNDYNTPSPVQVIDPSQIRAQGVTSMADLLQSVPDNNSGAVTTSFTGALAFGGSGISLR
jgi:iron complex outermembrane recepter protein